MQQWICMERSSRPPKAPPTPDMVKRTFSSGRPRAWAVCRWSTWSHWVARKRSTPPSSSGIARPDSGPRNAWSCMPMVYTSETTTSASVSGSPLTTGW